MFVKAGTGLLASACALLLAAVGARAQDFPSKPVRLIDALTSNELLRIQAI